LAFVRLTEMTFSKVMKAATLI